jgi:hypothetical protein
MARGGAKLNSITRHAFQWPRMQQAVSGAETRASAAVANLQ